MEGIHLCLQILVACLKRAEYPLFSSEVILTSIALPSKNVKPNLREDLPTLMEYNIAMKYKATKGVAQSHGKLNQGRRVG